MRITKLSTVIEGTRDIEGLAKGLVADCILFFLLIFIYTFVYGTVEGAARDILNLVFVSAIIGSFLVGLCLLLWIILIIVKGAYE